MYRLPGFLSVQSPDTICALRRSLILILGAWLSAMGCDTSEKKDDTDSEDAGTQSDAEVPSMYDTLTPLEIDITVPPEDWEALCSEGRRINRIGCETFSYTQFQAAVEIDGVSFEAVGIRKKGFLGSISTVRPSLKLNLGVNRPDQRYLGAKQITLNNDRQDATHLRQCLSYRLFREAGLPAPRCGLAHVTVNGEDLGIYSNIEPIKKPFLARAFGDDSGNLYEGQGLDVTVDQYTYLEVKTNEKENDTSDLKALAEVLEVTDSSFEAALADVVDIDAFLTFWAMEVLTGHWDSYSGNRNNYYLYHNPEDDLFYFIPWGTDGAFSDDNVFRPEDQTGTIYPNGEIARRLYALDNGVRFRERLNELFSERWNVDRILAAAEEISAAAGTAIDDADQVVNFIKHRERTLADDLEATIDAGERSPGRNAPVCDELPRSTGTIEVAWNDGGLPEPANVEGVEVLFEGRSLSFEAGSVRGMAHVSSTNIDSVEIGLFGTLSGTDRVFWLGFNVPMSYYEEGTFPFHGFETVGMVLELFPPTYAIGPLLAVISDGTLTLERVTDAVGETVRLSWDGVASDFAP